MRHSTAMATAALAPLPAAAIGARRETSLRARAGSRTATAMMHARTEFDKENRPAIGRKKGKFKNQKVSFIPLLQC